MGVLDGLILAGCRRAGPDGVGAPVGLDSAACARDGLVGEPGGVRADVGDQARLVQLAGELGGALGRPAEAAAGGAEQGVGAERGGGLLVGAAGAGLGQRQGAGAGDALVRPIRQRALVGAVGDRLAVIPSPGFGVPRLVESDPPAQARDVVVGDRADLEVGDGIVGLALQLALDDEAQHGRLHPPHASPADAGAGLLRGAPAHHPIQEDPDQGGLDAILVHGARGLDGAQQRVVGDLLEAHALAGPQVAQQALEVPGDAFALAVGVAGQVEGDLGVLGGLGADGAERGLATVGPDPGGIGQAPLA